MIAPRVPTLGDLVDVEMSKKSDIFAVVRLLQRWMDPAPTLEQLRELPILDVQTQLAEIFGIVQQGASLLLADTTGKKPN